MLRRIRMLIIALLTVSATAHAQTVGAPAHHLFVWTGTSAGTGNDFVVVVDADRASPNYGRLVTSAATDQRSVKAHHTEYEMPASGMLFANDHDANRTIILDLRNPRQPRQAAAFGSLAGYSMPHSFARLPNGNVLATFQYPDHGGHMAAGSRTGGLVEIDDRGRVVRSASNADPAFADEGLLPYGLAVLPNIDRVIVTNSPMGDDFLLTSNTYQIFRLSDLQLLGTYRLDPGPRRNGHVSPEEPRIGPDGAVYIQTLSCGIQRITGMEGPSPRATLVHQFPGSWCGVPTIVGNYLVQSVPAIHGYIVLDITDGARPAEVSRLVINDRYSPHWTGWDARSRRLVVTSGQAGDRMYLLELDQQTGALTLDERFRGEDGQPGFSFAARAWPHGWTGEGRPHGAVFSR